MAELTPHQKLKQRLEDIGIQVTITHYPRTHYSLRYSFVRAESDDASEALYQFLSELIKFVPVEKAQATHSGECVECGRVATLNSAGVCEGCVMQAMMEE